ncbi:MAG: DUF1934 domain-containing protein [Clostridia bacterium]|nr:DUF1934 domain-containing protein [Clostridia bacterium]
MTDSFDFRPIPVLVTMRSVQSVPEEEDETIEFVTNGIFSRKNGVYVLSYEESELTGLEGVRTTVTAEKGKVLLDRTGSLESHMVFEKNQRHLSLYETPGGVFTVGTVAMGVSCDLDFCGGNISLDYRLEIDNAFASRNVVELTVTRMNQPKGGEII